MLIFKQHNIAQFLPTLKELNETFRPTFHLRIRNKRYIICRKSHTTSQNSWKVLFFGSDEFAVESLKALHKKYKSKVLQRLEVVTAEQNRDNPVMKYAKQNKIVVNNWPVNVNKLEFHIGVVVSFGHLISSEIINAFPMGMINVHGSLLPRWRGAAPIIHSIMNGDSKTGITIMKIKPKKFDIGEIVLQKEIDIGQNETQPELSKKLAELGASTLEEMFQDLPLSLQSAKPQDPTKVTYAPKITSKTSVVDWNEMSATRVYNLQRALFGLHPIRTSFNDLKIKLFNMQTVESELVAKQFEGDAPGTVMYNKTIDALIVKCKEESFVSVKKITVVGKRTMSARDFYNGFLSGRKQIKVLFS
ncbi:methionyl-tRNA formyltransferase, mitochondrial [Ceratina calcarata]|uniref:Methionyl-tRNA formyltransferase, mitochondrial n=1 Tax=Ceratina calcarata TaxID=156304 RepID=A0AAJ7J774_9HYME|nr:methionyl-tRNA formyltransferase, mitochondrial [Ceratina calcarata]